MKYLNYNSLIFSKLQLKNNYKSSAIYLQKKIILTLTIVVQWHVFIQVYIKIRQSKTSQVQTFQYKKQHHHLILCIGSLIKSTSSSSSHRKILFFKTRYNFIFVKLLYKMNKFINQDYLHTSQEKKETPPSTLKYCYSEEKMISYSDLNDYPNRREQYQQMNENKGKFLLHFSSNSFLKNKMMKYRKTSDFIIAPLKIEKYNKTEQNKNNSPTLYRQNPSKYISNNESREYRALKSDRSMNYLRPSEEHQQYDFVKNQQSQSKKSSQSHLNFKISPRRRVSENYELTSKNYKIDHKRSLNNLFEVKLVEPDKTISRQKKLNTNYSSAYLNTLNQNAAAREIIPVQTNRQKLIKYKGSESKSSLSSSRGYFIRKGDSPLLNNQQKYLSIDSFTQIDKLGKGKFGDVFLVKHKFLNFICAMKVVQKEKIIKLNVVDQFCYQIKIQSYLEHPNLVSLYGMFHDQKNIYLLMELLFDNTLHRLMKAERRFDQKNTCKWIKQICIGVQYMHREKVMHRDIKPQNIIIHEGIAKIADFGWAAYYADESRTTFCGTPAYLSPQLLLHSEYNQKVDIWALGLLTYEMMIGSLPFKIKSSKDMQKITNQNIVFPQLIPVSQVVRSFISIALQKKPEDRGDIDTLLSHPFLSIKIRQLLNLDMFQEEVQRMGLFNLCVNHQIKSSRQVLKNYKRQVKEAVVVNRA